MKHEQRIRMTMFLYFVLLPVREHLQGQLELQKEGELVGILQEKEIEWLHTPEGTSHFLIFLNASGE